VSAIITTAEQPNMVRKQLPCLGCGEPCGRTAATASAGSASDATTALGWHTCTTTVLPRGHGRRKTPAFRALDGVTVRPYPQRPGHQGRFPASPREETGNGRCYHEGSGGRTRRESWPL